MPVLLFYLKRSSTHCFRSPFSSAINKAALTQREIQWYQRVTVGSTNSRLAVVITPSHQRVRPKPPVYQNQAPCQINACPFGFTWISPRQYCWNVRRIRSSHRLFGRRWQRRQSVQYGNSRSRAVEFSLGRDQFHRILYCQATAEAKSKRKKSS